MNRKDLWPFGSGLARCRGLDLPKGMGVVPCVSAQAYVERRRDMVEMALDHSLAAMGLLLGQGRSQPQYSAKADDMRSADS